VKLSRGRNGEDPHAQRAAAGTPSRARSAFGEGEIDDQIAALRDAVEAELGALDRVARRRDSRSTRVVPGAANGGRQATASPRAPRIDRNAVATISRMLALWIGGLAVAAIVGIVVAYVML
jgi:hypothetical protein